MIRSINISGFKCFLEQTFDFKKITILAGINSAGKSSLIQSILIAKEAELDRKSIPLDSLFGVNLGYSNDVINWNAVDEKISISVFSDDDRTFNCELTSTHDASLYLEVSRVKFAKNSILNGKSHRNFCYLSAERYGPKAEYQFNSKHLNELEIGMFGQNCAQILALQGNNPIEDGERLHTSTGKDEPKFLIYQLEKWLSEIVRPLKIKCEKIGGSSLATLLFKPDGNEWVKASNMGYGVTYALPVILAGLTTPSGGLLIIENPEAHLHPAGQSLMGEFIGWLSCYGVQVIVETHSDHVLNGIRIAIASNGKLKSDDAKVIFFEKNKNDNVFYDLSFTESGGVSDWPKSFFDQYQIDTAKLGKLRRSKFKNVSCN
jgi:predicted ATPase